MAESGRVRADKGSHRLERLEQGSLSERAYNAIRSSIIGGRFKPGERLVETDLAEDLGVSRAPIREAFRRLADEQLVVERPRYGTHVREFTAEDFVDIYNLLSAIESLAVRLIVRKRVSLEGLERIVEEMTRAAEEGDLERVVEVELLFHGELCSLAGNQYLESVFRLLSGTVGIALSLDDAAYANMKDIAAEHGPLLKELGEATESGDEEGAVFAVRSHIRASIGEVMTRLGGDPADVLGPLVQPGSQGADQGASHAGGSGGTGRS